MENRGTGWIAGSFAVIVVFTALAAARWQSFPLFLDMYYHGSCMTGFAQAGGVALHDFWEYAPVGRPHLYPPFVHVAMLGLYRLGLAPLSVMRLVSLAMYPATLFVMWRVSAFLWTERAAFFIVLCASVPYTFYLSLVNSPPASLALVMLLLLWYAMERERAMAGALLFGAVFYVHPTLPWVALASLAVYCALTKRHGAWLARAALGGMVLGSPWLIHAARHLGSFAWVSSYENDAIEVAPVIYALAAAGLFIAVRRKGRDYLPVALLAAVLPLLVRYRYRVMCGQGLLPLILLAGMALDALYGKMDGLMQRMRVRPAYCAVVPALIVYGMTFFSPVAWRDADGSGIEMSGSAFTHLAPGYRAGGGRLRSHEAAICTKRFHEELAGIVKRETKPADIVYCNYAYPGGMLTALTGRAASSGMLNEVRPPRFDPIAPATLIVWIKDPDGAASPARDAIVRRYRLEPVAETEIASVFRNPHPTTRQETPRPLLPERWAFLIMGVWLASLVMSLRGRSGREKVA